MRIFRLQSFGIFRSETLSRLAPAGLDFRLGVVAWELPFKIVRFESFSWKFCRLESFGEDLSLAMFLDLSLGNAQPACAGRLGLSLGILRLGTSVQDRSL